MNIIFTKNGKEYHHVSINNFSLAMKTHCLNDQFNIDLIINKSEIDKSPLSIQLTSNKTSNLMKIEDMKFSFSFTKSTSEITIIPNSVDVNSEKIVLLYTPSEMNILFFIYDTIVFIY